MKTASLCCGTVAVCLMLAGASQVHAADGTWNTNAAATWGDSANWLGGVPNAVGEIANLSQLDITANRTITLGANRTVGSLLIGDASGTNSYTITGNTMIFNNTGGATLTSSQSGGTNIISSNVTASSDLTVQVNGAGGISFQGGAINLANRTITNSGVGTGNFFFGGAQTTTITGSVAFVQNSASSQLRFTNTNMAGNTYAGSFSVLKGTLYYNTNRSDSMGTSTNRVTLGNASGGSDNATFQINNTSWSYTLGHPIRLAENTSGTLAIVRSGTAAFSTTLTGGITGTNSVVLRNAGSSQNLIFSTGTLNNIGTITNSGAGTGQVVVNSVIGTNVTGVTQNSATSLLQLNGVNAYTGPTTITAGTLALGASASLASDTISVGSGGVFNVSAVTGGYVVAAGKTLGGLGTLAGDATFAATSFLNFNPAGGLIATGTLTFGNGANFGIANLANVDWGSLTLDSPYTVVDTSQTFTAASIANFGLANKTPVGGGREAYFQAGGSGDLQLIVVPEPASIALALGGVAAMAFAISRRRQAA